MSAPTDDATPAPTLDEVAARLHGAEDNGTLTLSGAKLSAQEVDDVLDALGVTELALSEPDIKTGADSVIASGKTQILGVDADAHATFTVSDDALSVALEASLPEHTLDVVHLDWVSVGDLGLELGVTGPSLPVPLVSGALKGSIRIEGVDDPIGVVLGPAVGTGGWLLRATHIPLPDPVAVLTVLLAGHDAGTLTPPSLSLDGFEVEELTCRFDPSTLTPHSLTMSVGAPAKAWSLAPGLELSGVGLNLGLDFDGDQPSVAFGAGATITLPPLPPLPVHVSQEAGQWKVGIIGAHGFKSVAEMVKAVAPGAAGFLPDAVGTLTIDTVTLELTLGAGDPALRSVFFSTRLADRWTLVDGHLWLDQVSVELLVDRVNDSTTGFFAGTVAIEGVAVPVLVSKPAAAAPLTLRLGTATPPSVSGVSALSGVTAGSDLATHLPTGIGDSALALRELTVAFDPVAYKPTRLVLDVGFDRPWQVPGLGELGLPDLGLALDLAWPGPVVTGTVGGTIELGGPGLRITASRAAAADPWKISGAMVPAPGSDTLELGSFITALAAKLGALHVPAPLAKATLSRAELQVDTAGGVSFDCAGALPIDGQTLALELTITLARVAGGFHAQYDGKVTIAGEKFRLDVSTDPAVTRLVATYTHDAGLPPIDVGKLLPELSGLDLEVDVKDAVFALASDGTTRVAFALDLGHIDLSGLPLVGSVLGDAAKVDDLRILAATGALADDVKAWNTLLGQPLLPPQGVERGVSVSGRMALGDSSTNLSLPATAPAPAAGAGAAAADSTKWFPVQRSFGPVHFDRVGARYDTGVLWLVLDASLSLGGLSLDLMGLAVGSPLKAFDPKFHLDGLGIAFSQDPLEIAGAFLSVPGSRLGDGEAFRYDGAAVVRAESFALSAVGSYAQGVDGHPSMFVFAELDAPLGGPPPFFITGLMGGFGYNRSLRIPRQDEIFQFPFVTGLAGPAGKGTPEGVLTALEGGWLHDEAGVDWLAAGVHFTSFEVVDTRALLIAEFGRELQLALVGLSKLRLPQEGEEFAYLELELEAVLKPQEGFFGLSAELSPNSFVISPACRLTGGFAFYVWFAGDHAGDFVLTLGGYHPQFTPHDWYPKEPRLALSWPVSDLVTIAGEAYFALTPSCVMGGGGLRVLFHDGALQAWLTASADFLVAWKPFRYSAQAGVSVGVSYRVDWWWLKKTFSVELGAQLSMWGPPTGGRARISWWVISFTVGFGPDPPAADAVKTWSQFAPLLPAAADLCKVTIQSGLLPGKVDGDPVVRADSLQLVTECAVPAARLELAGRATKQPFLTAAAKPAIRPLQLIAVDSAHTLHVKDPGGSEVDLEADGWTVKERKRNLPEALWGTPLGDHPPLPDAKLVPDQLVGFTISPPGPRIGPTRGEVDMDVALRAVPVDPSGVLPLGAAAVLGAPAPGVNADGAASAAVLSVLAALDLDPVVA